MISRCRFVFLFIVFFATSGFAHAQQAKPNVIFILCDDLGYGDIGVLRSDMDAEGREKFYGTPNLDQMAERGAILSQHYCPAPVCAPSRASLLLGQHQGNCAIRDNQFDKALPDQPTLGTVMQAAGYATAIIGKYGLQGDQRYAMEKNGTKPAEWPAYPTKRGFDEFFGYVRHVDGHLHYPAHDWSPGNSETHRTPKELWHNDREISDDLTKCYTTDLFTAKAKHYVAVQAAKRQPFFLYLAYDTPHAALQVPTCDYPEGRGVDGGLQWLGAPGKMINTAIGEMDSYRHPATTGRGWSDEEERFATMVRRIDDCVGDLLQTLEDLGIAKNTLVVLTSDNGPHHESYLADSRYDPTSFQSYGPFDGTKRDVWEGGIRMPTLAWWPGKIPAGTTDDSPSQFHDWMATLADVADVPRPALCDGVSLLPTMTGQDSRDPSTVYVEYNQNGRTKDYADFSPDKRGQKRGQMQAIVTPDFKALRTDIQRHEDPFQLYDLSGDPSEQKNLAGSESSAMQRQQIVHDLVLRLRRPNESAPRPYDDQLVPASQIEDGGQGGMLKMGENPTTYVGSGHHDGLRLEDVTKPMQKLPSGNSATVSTWLSVPEDGDYTIAMRSEHPAVLRMHGFVLLDRSRADQPNTRATIGLRAGLHEMQLHLQAPDGDVDYELLWSRADSTLQPIPAERFRTRR